MGDVTSGGVQDDAAANADISGGGGGDTSPSTPASLGFGGARGDIVARQTTPAPVVETPRVAFNNQPMSGDFFVNRVSRGLQNLFSGGTQTDDRGPSGADVGAVSVDDNQFNRGLASLSGVPDFVRIGGGTSSPTRNTGPFIPDPPTVNVDPTMAALRRGAPALMASNAAEEAVQTAVAPPKFMFDSPQSPEEFRREEEKIASMTGGARNIIDPLQTLYQRGFTPGEDIGALYGRGFDPTLGEGALTQAALPAARPAVIDTQPKTDANAAAAKLAALARSGSGGAKTKEELNLLQRLGRFLKGVGKSISNFEMSDIFEFLRGDPNFKGTPSSAIDPFAQQGMGPGPFVGGGAPSPSGGGGMPMPVKDPCPPGFRFDPTLQQCVPIIAPNTPTDTTTTPTTPTTPAPGTSPPVAGGIANAYPFVLTPPIGTPVGNLPPVRLTT